MPAFHKNSPLAMVFASSRLGFPVLFSLLIHVIARYDAHTGYNRSPYWDRLFDTQCNKGVVFVYKGQCFEANFRVPIVSIE